MLLRLNVERSVVLTTLVQTLGLSPAEAELAVCAARRELDRADGEKIA